MTETAIIASAALAYLGLHLHIYLAGRSPKGVVAQVSSYKDQVHEAFAHLGQKIETSKVAGNIERIICASCHRKVFKFHADGVCTDCRK